MPSVPSRLVSVFGCVLTLSLATPALADKQPGKTPPPPVTGLQAPSGGADASANAQLPPQASTPAAGGPAAPAVKAKKGKGGRADQSQFTAKTRKGGGGSGSVAQSRFTSKAKPDNGGGQAGSTSTTASGKASARASAPTPANGSTATTLAGGTASTPAPSTPVTPAGSVAAPKHKTSHHAARHRGIHNHRSSGTAAPRTTLPATRPVNAAPAGPPAPAPPKPAPRKEKRSDRGLARVRVSVVTRTVHDIVRVIPGPVKAVIGAMAALLLAAIAAWTTVTLRAGRLRRHRGQLLQEVGLLQAALLPEIPAQIGPLAASVAYRPAEGPGAGGDFYDIFELENGDVGLVLGDMAGHGRDALARTALVRYTLRAYLETGLEPRTALRLAGETLDHTLGGAFATAAVARYNAEQGTLTYSCAGHPPPILLGAPAHDPVVACSAPPIGVSERTGIRQTTVPLPPGAVACFFTDGLAEARVHGDLFGRERVTQLAAGLGDELTGSELIDAIRDEVHHLPDDMAACVFRPLAGVASDPAGGAGRIEELELREGGERDLRRFLAACGIPAVEIGDLIRSADARAEDYGGAIVRVTIVAGDQPRVSLVLPLVEMLG